MSAKKNTTRVTILNEEYAIRTDTSPEHAHAVAKYLDLAIRRVLRERRRRRIEPRRGARGAPGHRRAVRRARVARGDEQSITRLE